MSVIAKLRGKLLLGIALGALVYLLILVYSGWGDVREALSRFPWAYAPALLALAFLNYVFRFLKWDYYLGFMGIKIRKGDSFLVFLSGLVMVISPGKIGELIKTVFLKRITGVELSRSMPIVIAERLTDFIALVLISFAGIGFLATGEYVILLVVAGLLVGFILVIANRRASLALIRGLEKMPLVGKLGRKLHTAYESMSSLLRVGPLAVATLLSVIAWLCECLGLYIVIRLMNGGAGLLSASFIYAFGTIVGAVAPGGLGVTDGTLIAMLQNNAMMAGQALSKAGAGTATMIIRMATLWFAVLVGAAVLLLFQKRFAGVENMLDQEQEKQSETD